MVEVELYNLNSNRWVSCPSLNSRKGSLAGVCLSDKIFAIGGGNAAGCLSEVEMLDLNIGKWIFTCSMMQKVIHVLYAGHDMIQSANNQFDVVGFFFAKRNRMRLAMCRISTVWLIVLVHCSSKCNNIQKTIGLQLGGGLK